jgi:hypothetical protein
MFTSRNFCAELFIRYAALSHSTMLSFLILLDELNPSTRTQSTACWPLRSRAQSTSHLRHYGCSPVWTYLPTSKSLVNLPNSILASWKLTSRFLALPPPPKRGTRRVSNGSQTRRASWKHTDAWTRYEHLCIAG